MLSREKRFSSLWKLTSIINSPNSQCLLSVPQILSMVVNSISPCSIGEWKAQTIRVEDDLLRLFCLSFRLEGLFRVCVSSHRSLGLFLLEPCSPFFKKKRYTFFRYLFLLFPEIKHFHPKSTKNVSFKKKCFYVVMKKPRIYWPNRSYWLQHTLSWEATSLGRVVWLHETEESLWMYMSKYIC